MTQYVKYISNTEIEYPPKNNEELGILNYDLDIDRLIADGYKILIPVEIPKKTNRLFHIEYRENSDNIEEIIVYEETQEEADEREQNAREQQFNKDFFQTSLGYVRRSVTMDNGSHKDFLSDLLPSIAIAINSGLTVNVLTYDKPDFSQEIIDWTQYQHMRAATAQFVQECFVTLQSDFIPTNI